MSSARHLRRTARAEEDLIDIWVYIARNNKAAADRVLDALDERTSLLARYPELGRSREDIAADVRSFRFGEYLILYRVKSEVVEIVRYVHGRRDLKETV